MHRSASSKDRSWLALWFSAAIFRRALLFSLAIGTLLGAINHGYAIAAGEMSLGRWLSLGLTYLVPYCVSSASAAMQAATHKESLRSERNA